MSLEPQRCARRKLIAAARRARTHLAPPLPPAFFLTDPARTPDPRRVASGLPAGFGVVYRHFGVPGRVRMAQDLARICRRRGLILLIAGDPALAREVGADGVHWPFRQAQAARHWRSRFSVQTASAHTARELRAACRLAVDAVMLSTVFASRSASAGVPIGAARLRILARASRLAVYGLGGVSSENAGQITNFAGFSAIDGATPFALAD